MNINSKERKGVEFEIIGTNYKLSNIQAAIGLEQLKEIDSLLSRRRELAKNYISLLKDSDKVSIPSHLKDAEHSYQSFCIHIDDRDDIMNKMRAIGIEVQIGTYSLHMHKAFYDNDNVRICGDMKNSKFAFYHTLTLPLFHELTFEQQKMIVQKLLEFLK
jgi:dTDP-4-amino-4,6-dideoxygalactose transaminase